jgi:hypothetical protein
VHSTIRLTPPALKSAGSPISGWKAPLVKSEAADVAALLRSSDFGVKTISGLPRPDRACQRSRWK